MYSPCLPLYRLFARQTHLYPSLRPVICLQKAVWPLCTRQRYPCYTPPKTLVPPDLSLPVSYSGMICGKRRGNRHMRVGYRLDASTLLIFAATGTLGNSLVPIKRAFPDSESQNALSERVVMLCCASISNPFGHRRKPGWCRYWSRP